MANNYDLSDLAVPENQGEQNFDLSDLESGEEGSPQEKTGFLGSMAKGAVSGALGAIPDILTMPYNLAAMSGSGQVYHPNLERSGMEEFAKQTGTPLVREQMPLIPSVTEALSKGISKYAGETPEEYKHLEKGAEFVGGLALPGGIAKGAAKLGQIGTAKAFGKIGTTSASELAGAGVAGTAMSKLQKEGAGLPAEILGGIGAGGLTTGALKGIGKLKNEAIPYLLSLGAKPNEKVIENAKKLGATPPMHVQLNSKLSRWLNNSYLKTVIASDDFTNSVKSADKQMIELTENTINSVNPHFIENQIGSENYQNALKQEMQEVKQINSELHQDMLKDAKSAGDLDLTPVNNVLKELKEDLSGAPRPGPHTKYVLELVEDLQKRLGLTQSPQKAKKVAPGAATADELNKFNKLIGQTEKTPVKKPGRMSVSSAIDQRKNLLDEINYGLGLKGTERLILRITDAFKDAILTIPNEPLKKKFLNANKFTRDEVANRIRTDFAQSLVEGEFPKLAYSFMSDPRRVKELERLLGNQSNVKEIMNSLKRTKLQELVLDKIQPSPDVMSYARLSTLFDKKSKDIGMYKELFGEKNYNKIKELTEISREYVKAGVQFANPSGTAAAKADIDRVGNIMANLLTIGTLGAANPYWISKAVSNPEIVDKAVKYATARQQGKLGQALKYHKELKELNLKNILPQVREAEAHSHKESFKEGEVPEITVHPQE